jgi:hypothetical protein
MKHKTSGEYLANMKLKGDKFKKENYGTKDQALDNKKVSIKKSAFIKEHKHLLKVLKTGRGAKQEFKEQKEELNKYK